MNRMKLCCGFAAALALCLAGCKGSDANETTVDTANAEATMNTILSRTSVRAYSGDTLPAGVMERLLRAAMAAPTGMDVRPWRFVVLRDTSKYDSIFAGNFNMDMYKRAAAVVVFCADTTVTRPPREQPEAAAVTTPNSIWRDDMGACVENFLLAAAAHGLGGCWTACYPFAERMDPVRAALALPSQVVPYAVVPVGYPIGAAQPKDKWNASNIHYDRW